LDSLLPYALIDTVLFILAGLLVVKRGAFWHPITMYLVFHGYTVTWRIWELALGLSLPMYANQVGRDSITLDEIARGMIMADASLVIFCLGCWLAYNRFHSAIPVPVLRRPISATIVTGVCIFCLPLGAYALISFQGGNFADNFFTRTNYFQVMTMWPIGCLSMLVFVHGFRTILLVPIAAYLLMAGTQGYHRFMLILPVLFFTFLYLQRSGRRWPGVVFLVPLFLLFTVFPVLKYVGRAVQNGDNQEAARLIAASFSGKDGFEELSKNEAFLDQFSGALSLVDDTGKKFKGGTYVAIITLPVPRTLWPGKPGLADHLADISTTVRPYQQEGRVITYIGESYLNFRHAGVIIVPFLLGLWLTSWCMRATAGPFPRFERYLYCVFSISFLQLYRDGMTSLVVFTICHNLPMVFVWFLHSVPGFAPKVLDAPGDQVAMTGRPDLSPNS